MRRLLPALFVLALPAFAQVTNNSSVTGVTSQNNVKITGGSIDGTTIGASTPAAGAFTTVNGNTISTGTGTLTLGAGKTFTASSTTTLTSTDGATLAIGAGGTLGSAAYTASTAYLAVAGIAANSSQLMGATWAAPGAIGSTTPSTGAFTTLSATSGGSISHAICWKAGGLLGYCSTVPDAGGACTCN